MSQVTRPLLTWDLGLGTWDLKLRRGCARETLRARFPLAHKLCKIGAQTLISTARHEILNMEARPPVSRASRVGAVDALTLKHNQWLQNGALLRGASLLGL
jgi:hypothetical protein